MCERAGIPLLEMEGLGKPIGQPERMTAAVTDANFAKMIAEAFAKAHTAN